MKILMFSGGSTEYILFTNSSYDWEFLKRRYPLLQNTVWKYDKIADVDSTGIPLDTLISFNRLASNTSPAEKNIVKTDTIERVLGLTEEKQIDSFDKITQEEIEVAFAKEPPKRKTKQ